ncbi:ATP-grasp domain-containing protein [soil metagenome]
MKKILLLGGSDGQLPAIHEANRRGYYTILCDYLPDNPCREFADEYHEISTTDKESILELARRKKIDYIFTYASDPATPTSAYVADKLKLPGSTYESVKLLSDKDLFRTFLQRNGFSVPAFVITDKDYEIKETQQLTLPVVVKPVDSSDTKGVAVVNETDQIGNAVEAALEFSRKKKVIIEEFVDASVANLHGDAFFIDGEMVFCMLGDRIFSSDSNPLKPSTELYPSRVSPELISRIEDAIAKIVKKSGFTFGAVNIEVRVDQNERIYVMEIGPRSGGTLTPETIAHSTGFNMLKATFDYFENEHASIKTQNYQPAICFALHANRSGIFENIQYSPQLLRYLAEKHIYLKKGDPIKPYSEPGSTIGVLIFKFPDMNEAERIIETLYTDIQAGIIIKST